MGPGRTDLPSSFDPAVLQAIEMIYEAATEPSQWPVVLEALARWTKCELAALALHDIQASSRSGLWWFGIDPALVAEDETWAPKNPFIAKARSLSLIRSGWVCNSEDVLPLREARRTEYFNEYLRKVGAAAHVAGCIVQESTVASFLFMPRKIGKAPPSAKEVDFVRALMPHFARAMAIHRRLGDLSVANATTREMLDRLPFGVVLLDRHQRALTFNRTAEEILAARDGLALSAQSQLIAARSDVQASLARVVHEACRTGDGKGSGAGGPMLVPRPSGLRPFALLVTPVRLLDHDAGSQVPAAAVFVTDPERQPDDPRQLLQRLYGLTPAESGVARLLFEGRSVNELSDALSITLGTARIYVKRILAKVGCRSQSDLIRVLWRGPAGLRSPAPLG
jgi:DNA-binding CsgD family transcriptional regulator